MYYTWNFVSHVIYEKRILIKLIYKREEKTKLINISSTIEVLRQKFLIELVVAVLVAVKF